MLSFIGKLFRKLLLKRKQAWPKKQLFLRFPDVKKKRILFIYHPNGNNTFVI
jgi:hypothetical protein